MRRIGWLRPCSVLVVLLALLMEWPGRTAEAAGDAEAAAPVLLELFTSQGCSSCPPADRLLHEIGEEPGVIALSFHVDYWNRLGWKDPFSHADYSNRQRRYARALGEPSVYTPQVVVDGRAHVVGSQEEELRREIAASHAHESPLGLELELGTVDATSARLRIRATGLDRLDVVPLLFVAVAERGLVTRVSRGENAHRTLENDYVVRYLEAVGALRGSSAEQDVRLPLEAGWVREHLQLVAFVQAEGTMAVLAAARVPSLVSD